MNQDKELQEAKVSLERTLRKIDSVRDELKSAKNWGIADILGMGSFVSLIKRDKIRKINESMNELQYQLETTSEELKDISEIVSFRIPNDFGSQFFDIFFDNIFTDISTQKKLKAADKNLEELHRKLSEILTKINKI